MEDREGKGAQGMDKRIRTGSRGQEELRIGNRKDLAVCRGVKGREEG